MFLQQDVDIYRNLMSAKYFPFQNVESSHHKKEKKDNEEERKEKNDGSRNDKSDQGLLSRL